MQIDVDIGTPLTYVTLQLHTYIFLSQLSRLISYTTIYTQEESNTSATPKEQFVGSVKSPAGPEQLQYEH